MGEKVDSRVADEGPPVRDVQTLELRILRQDALERPSSKRWEVFSVNVDETSTLADGLRAIQRNPKTTDGVAVVPVAFDYECQQGICGACSVLVNGRVTRACTAKLNELSPRSKRLDIAPLGKFPVVRDLVVDRSSFENDLRTVASQWDTSQPQDAAHGLQTGEAQQRLYALTRCTTCGACLEACPQYGSHSDFLGAAVLAQLESQDHMPMSEIGRSERLELAMAPGGIDNCANAENCVEVCPVGVPLVDSLGRLSRATTRQWLKGWLLG